MKDRCDSASFFTKARHYQATGWRVGKTIFMGFYGNAISEADVKNVT